MGLDLIVEGVYVSPIQLEIHPLNLRIADNSILPKDDLMKDLISKITIESALQNKYVAVSEEWIINKYLGTNMYPYEKKVTLNPINLFYTRQRIECTLSSIVDKKIFRELDQHIQETNYTSVFYLTEKILENN